jgi:hypothetical protein
MAVKHTKRGILGGLHLSDTDAEYVASAIIFLLNQQAEAKRLKLWRGAPGSEEADLGGWTNTHAIWALAELLSKRQLAEAFAHVSEDAPDEMVAGVRIALIERGLRDRAALKRPSDIAMAELLEGWLQAVDVSVFAPEGVEGECAWCWPLVDPARWRVYPGGLNQDGSPRSNPAVGRVLYRLPSVVPTGLSRHLPRDLRRTLDGHQIRTAPEQTELGPWGPSWDTLKAAEAELLRFLRHRYPNVALTVFMTPSSRADFQSEVE